MLPNADYVAEDREVERREIEDVEGVVPLPGALELLQSLPLDRWAIVTSCTKTLAHVRIRAAGLPEPKFIVTASDITKGKPDSGTVPEGSASTFVEAKDCVRN